MRRGLALAAIAAASGLSLQLWSPEASTELPSLSNKAASSTLIGNSVAAASIRPSQPIAFTREPVLTKLTVHLRDSDGSALSGIHVEARACEVVENRGVNKAYTDASGTARLAVPALATPYMILANWDPRTRPDCMREAVELRVDSNGPQTLDLELSKLECGLMARVVDDLGNPLPGVHVCANFENRTAVTKADGRAFFEHLPTGDRPVTIRIPVDKRADTKAVTFKRGVITQAAFVVPRLARLNVALSAPMPAGVTAEIRLVAEDAGGRGCITQRVTGAQAATFDGLLAGNYWVTCRIPGHSPWTYDRRELIAVTAGADRELRLELTKRSGVLSGTVVDIDWQPVAGAAVQVFLRGANGEALAVKRTVSGADGSYELRGVAPGEVHCWVDVESIPNACYRPFDNGGTPLVQLQGSMSNVVIRLMPGHRILGKVVWATTGQPLPNQQVCLTRIGHPASRYTNTRINKTPPRMIDSALDVGWFEFDNLAPGSYQISCGEGTARVHVDLTILDDDSEWLHTIPALQLGGQ